MNLNKSWYAFIIFFGISACIISCNSRKEVPALVIFTQALVSEPGSASSIVEVPKGSVIKYLGEATPDSSMFKVSFRNNTGWIPSWSVALKGKAGVIISDGKFSPEDNGPLRDLPAATVVAVDTIVGENMHILYADYNSNLATGWFPKDQISLDTADVALATEMEAIRNLSSSDQTKAYTIFFHDHPNSGFLSVIGVNLVEAPVKTVNAISDKYGFVIDKGAGKITMLRSLTNQWLNDYLTDIFNYPFGDQVASPTSNYFQRYVDQLPAFVKNGPHYDGPNMGEEQSLKAYLLFRMDRRPENIKKLYPLFRSAIIPHVSMQSILVHMNHLITVHDHIFGLPNYKQLCENISKQIAARDAAIKYLGSEAYDQRDIYQPIFHGPTMEEFQPFYGATMGIWYHSFWVRRMREGNADVVYEILKDLATTVQTMNPDLANADSGGERGDSEGTDESAEPQTMVCVFQNFTIGDCGHMEFDCGDYGEADISQLSSEGQELWKNLGIEDQDGPHGNPVYVGRKFQMTVGTTTGTICNEGQGGQGSVPQILSFVLLDK